VAQVQEVWVQNCLVTSCHFQASSHFRNLNTFNLQDWLALILYVGVWSTKYFCQNTLWKKHLLISKQQKNRKYMFRSRMRCDPKTKMRNDNSTIKWWTIQHHSWINFSGHICVLPSNFDHLLFWWCSGDKMIDDIIFHKLSSILETLASVQLKWPRNPPWYSHLV